MIDILIEWSGVLFVALGEYFFVVKKDKKNSTILIGSSCFFASNVLIGVYAVTIFSVSVMVTQFIIFMPMNLSGTMSPNHLTF